MSKLKGKHVYVVFDKYQAVHVFEEPETAIHYIEGEAEFALPLDIYKKRVKALENHQTVYPTMYNSEHQVRAVKTIIK